MPPVLVMVGVATGDRSTAADGAAMAWATLLAAGPVGGRWTGRPRAPAGERVAVVVLVAVVLAQVGEARPVVTTLGVPDWWSGAAGGWAVGGRERGEVGGRSTGVLEGGGEVADLAVGGTSEPAEELAAAGAEGVVVDRVALAGTAQPVAVDVAAQDLETEAATRVVAGGNDEDG